MKLKRLDSPAAVTFLKGMWYPTSKGLWVWGPLPSRFLKATKSLKDPRQMYRTRDLYKAAELYLNDVAHSYAPFVRVPVLRAFIERFLQGPKIKDLLGKHQVQAAGKEENWLSDVGELDFSGLYDRYGVDETDVLQAELLICVSSPGMMIVHPLFDALVDADYM